MYNQITAGVNKHAYTGKSFADKAGQSTRNSERTHQSSHRRDHFEELDVSVPAQAQRLN